jgi:hypothetical protein
MDTFPTGPAFPPASHDSGNTSPPFDPLIAAALPMLQTLRRLPELLPDDDAELTRLRAGVLALALTARETTQTRCAMLTGSSRRWRDSRDSAASARSVPSTEPGSR